MKKKSYQKKIKSLRRGKKGKGSSSERKERVKRIFLQRRLKGEVWGKSKFPHFGKNRDDSSGEKKHGEKKSQRKTERDKKRI